MRYLRMGLGAAAAAVVLVALASAPAAAQPPGNDDFDGAVPVTSVPFSAEADTTEATVADDDPACVGGDLATVWYDVQLGASTEIVIDTFGSDYDTTLSAWTGDRGALSQVACNDDSGSLQSRIAFTAEPGVVYHVMVGAFPESPAGHLVLNGQALPPAMVLTASLDGSGTVTSAGAAVIHGRVTCSRPGDLTVTGTLREQQGRRATVGSYTVAVHCTGSTAWQATVLGETGIYKRGSATGVAVAEFVDQVRQQVVRARATGTVQLR
jgi:hypothetical protein